MTIDIDQRTGKSAAEIVKGELSVLNLSEADVVNLLDNQQLLDGLATGFIALSEGIVQSPARPEITVPGKGFSLSMPAWVKGMNITVKIVNVFEDNLQIDLPNHLALINLFDPVTGQPVCVMDGTHITAIRTAASAVLSVRELARNDSRIVTLIGAGVQGREHLKLLPLVRDFREIRIASLYFEDAAKLAKQNPLAYAVEDVESAVRSSDVVCLASHSYDAVIQRDWVRAGTHVSSVGYAPPKGELPADLVRSAKLFVETADAFKSPPVGCSELESINPSFGTTLGDVLSGKRSGRTSDSDITVYKAMGIAMQDMVAADIVWRMARQTQTGQYTTI